MSKSVFASLTNIDFSAVQYAQSSNSVATTGQKRLLPDDIEQENSQEPRANPAQYANLDSQIPPAPSGPSIANFNVITKVKQHLAAKEASISDLEEVLKFINEPPAVREALLYTELVLARSRNQSTHQYQGWIPENKVLIQNLKAYSLAINLSATIKSHSPKSSAAIIWCLIHSLRAQWNVPPDVFDDISKKRLLDTVIKYHLTQARGTIKKRKLMRSIQEGKEQDIYTLVKALVDNTDIQISLPLCYRAAVWRAVLNEMIEENKNQNNYWTEVNRKLAWIREQTKDDPRRTHYLLEKVFENDQKLYGKVSQIDITGRIVTDNNLVVATNVEKNIDAAFSAISNKSFTPPSDLTSNTPDHVIDPALRAISVYGSSIITSSDQPSRPITPASDFNGEDEDDPDPPYMPTINLGGSSYSASSEDGY